MRSLTLSLLLTLSHVRNLTGIFNGHRLRACAHLHPRPSTGFLRCVLPLDNGNTLYSCNSFNYCELEFQQIPRFWSGSNAPGPDYCATPLPKILSTLWSRCHTTSSCPPITLLKYLIRCCGIHSSSVDSLIQLAAGSSRHPPKRSR